MKIIRIDEEEGNAHCVMATVEDMLQQIHGRSDAEPIVIKYRKEAMSGDYENLKEVSKKYVPGLIEFAKSDEVEVTYKIRNPEDDDNWWDKDEWDEEKWDEDEEDEEET